MNTLYAEQINTLLNQLAPEGAVMFSTAAAIGFACAAVGVCVGMMIRILCRWRYFSKAGDSGWKALIPVYSTYTEYALSWNTKMFWLLMAADAACVLVLRLAPAGSPLILLAAALALLQVVIALRQTHKLSQVFGYGIGFTLGMIFLRPVFLLILAFGRARYIGPVHR